MARQPSGAGSAIQQALAGFSQTFFPAAIEGARQSRQAQMELALRRQLAKEEETRTIAGEQREEARDIEEEKRKEALRRAGRGEELVIGEFERRQEEKAKRGTEERAAAAAEIRTKIAAGWTEDPVTKELVPPPPKTQDALNKLRAEYGGLLRKRDLISGILSGVREPTSELGKIMAEFKGVSQQGLKTKLAEIEGELEERRLRLEEEGVDVSQPEVAPSVQKLIDRMRSGK